MNMLAAMGAYCFFAVKPKENFDFDVAPSDGQLVLWEYPYIFSISRPLVSISNPFNATT